MDKLISICLATYNGEKYLEEQLNSILNQTYKNFELIVQDDCSTDNTIKILESYQDKLNIIISKNEINMGYIKNFETLLKKATGDYVAICDQDDIWELDKLEILVRNIQDNILIYSNSLLIDENGTSLNKTLSTKLKNNFSSSNSCLNFLYDNSVSAHSMLFKKELLKYIFPFPKHIYFDAWIAATASSFNSIEFVDKCLINYRQHSSNTLGNVKKNSNSLKNKVISKSQKKHNNINSLIMKIDEMMTLKTISKDELKILQQLRLHCLEFEQSWFNINMFLFLIKHKEILFKITKKNKFILALKKSIGKKLYKAAPFL